MNLRWNKTQEARVKQVLLNPPKNLLMGCNCFFIPLSKKVGAKLYPDKTVRDISYDLQRRIPKITNLIAPKVGSKFSLSVIAPVEDIFCAEWPFEKKRIWGYVTERAELVQRVPKAIIEEICLEIQNKTEFETYDICTRNIGIIGNYYCLIDYDPVSLCDEF